MYCRSEGDDTPDETGDDWRNGRHRVRRSRVRAWHGRGYAPTGRKGHRVRRSVRSEARLTADRAGKKRRPSSPTCRRTVLGNRHRRPLVSVVFYRASALLRFAKFDAVAVFLRRYQEDNVRGVHRDEEDALKKALGIFASLDSCCEGYGTEFSCNDPAPPKGLDTWTR